MFEFYILAGVVLSFAVCIYVVMVISKETGEEKAERKAVEMDFKAMQQAHKEAERIKQKVSKLSDAELDKYLDK